MELAQVVSGVPGVSLKQGQETTARAASEPKAPPLFEGLFGLHGEAKRNVGRAIKHFKDLIAKQAAKLASGSAARDQLDAPITGVAVRAGDVGFFHRPDICREGEW